MDRENLRQAFEQARQVYHEKRDAFVAATASKDENRMRIAGTEATAAFLASEKAYNRLLGQKDVPAFTRPVTLPINQPARHY